MSDRELLLNLIGSLTLDEHMGDVADSVLKVLATIGIATPNADEHDDFWPGLRKDLHLLGVTTLWGSELWSADDEDDEDDES